MKSGNFEIKALNVGNFALDGGAMFGVVPKALWEKFYTKADDLNRIKMATRILLIKNEDKVIVVDSGNGNKIDAKNAAIYDINLQDSLTLTLAQEGVKPEDVTHFIYTHFHFDHAGGSTIQSNDGKIEPLFKNAKHYVQQKHYDWAMKPTLKDRASFMPNDYMPLIENQMIEFVNGDGLFLDNIEAMTLNGHTSNMQGLRIDTGENVFYFMADLIPTSAHLRYAFGMGYDNFPLTAIEEKHKYLPKIYEEEGIVIFEHDAFTPAVKLQFDGKNYTVGQVINL